MKPFSYSLSIILSVLLFLSCGTESTPTYTLSTSVVGEGNITPSGGEFDEGETVTLTGTPSEHWLFGNWSGDGSGSSNSLTITMDSDKNVVGNFIEREYTINYTINGNGDVDEEVIQPKGEYTVGTVVQLTPIPTNGWKFIEWSNWDGEVDEENRIVITVDGETNITVTFERIDYTLTITIEGEGEVIQDVVSSHKSTDYPFETVVKLTPVPSDEWGFISWSGDINSTEEVIEITIEDEINIIAKFSKWPEVNTFEAENVKETTALLRAVVKNDGGSEVTERGICIYTNTDGSEPFDCYSRGGGTGDFSVEVTGLAPDVTYYASAYAVNAVGTGIGNQIEFTTKEETFLLIGEPYLASDGLTVTLNSYQKIEKTGSFEYRINYTLKNNTKDQEISEGQFKLFYLEKDGGEQQFGFFGSLFPGDSRTRGYTFEALKDVQFKFLAYHDEIFFANSPPEDALIWNINDL